MAERSQAQAMGWRLKTLREEKCLSYEGLASALKSVGTEISPDSLKNYETRRTGPKMSADKLRGFALLYGVSTDYLLGLTTTRSTDTTVRAVCDATGLSQKAAENVTGYNYYYKVGDEKVDLPGDQGLNPSEVLNLLLESEEFWQVLGNLSMWTKPQMREFFRQADEWNPLQGVLPTVPGCYEPNPAIVPLVTPTRDCYLAEAIRHFGIIAEKILRITDQNK